MTSPKEGKGVVKEKDAKYKLCRKRSVTYRKVDPAVTRIHYLCIAGLRGRGEAIGGSKV